MEKAKLTPDLSFFLLFIFLISWLIYTNAHKSWLRFFDQFFAWVIRPHIEYNPIYVSGLGQAVLATALLLVLGALATNLLLDGVEDKFLYFITLTGLGFGAGGLAVAVLGILQALYWLHLNTILGTCIALLLALSYLRKARTRLWSRKTGLGGVFISLRLKPSFSLFLGFVIGLFIALTYYDSLTSSITNVDALIYHATMAKIMFNYHGVPLIAGPSTSLEFSGNFPPLFQSIGAYYYLQIGRVDDFYLRFLTTTMALLTVLVTYKIGRDLYHKDFGLVSALFVTATPIFVYSAVQALNYSTLAFYLSITYLFMQRAMLHRIWRLWALCGLFYGFAALTSYQALYFLPGLMLILIHLPLAKKTGWRESLAPFLASFCLVGGVWYLRNALVLGNPLYPFGYEFFGGLHVDHTMFARVMEAMKWVGFYVTFGHYYPIQSPTILDFVRPLLLFDRNLFPALGIPTWFGVSLILAKETRLNAPLYPLLVWLILPMLFIFTGPTIFPRYFIPLIPISATVTCLPLIEAHKYLQRRGAGLTRLAKFLCKALLLTTLLAIILFPGLSTSVMGKMYQDVRPSNPPDDFLWYFTRPGVDVWTELERTEGEGIRVWQWLNEAVKPGEKIATFDPRIYYVKDANLSYFFFLDGWEARRLYKMSDPVEMLKFLREERVSLIVISNVVAVGQQELPLTRFLGSAHFPLILKKGSTSVYSVGPSNTTIAQTVPD